jgi:ComEC/Rec2-related protein
MLPHMQKKMRVGDVAFYISAVFLIGVFVVDQRWNIGFVEFMFFVVMMILVLRHSISWKYFGLLLLAGIFGIFYCRAYISWYNSHVHLPHGKQAVFFGTVDEQPKRAGNFLMAEISLEKPYRGTIDLFTSPSRQINYGDFLWMKGTVDISTSSDELPVIFLPQLSTVTVDNGFFLKNWSIKIKAFISNLFGQYFSSDKSALLSAIVLGNTNTVSAPLKEEMDASGTSYIVGMYGYKIAIICVAIAAFLKGILPRKTLLFFTIGIVWLFIFISGGSISAVRAGIMGSLALLAAVLGRMFVARNALLFTALVMALIDPLVLGEGAFQLSFLSFLGIYYLGEPIKNFFHWTDDGWLQWKEHAMLALTTNLAILPVVINVFGDFSLTSFVSNILIMIPWVVIIFLGIIIIPLGLASPVLAFIPIQLENILLSYELFVIHVFARFVIPIPNIFTSTLAIIFYYGILGIFIYYYGEES